MYKNGYKTSTKYFIAKMTTEPTQCNTKEAQDDDIDEGTSRPSGLDEIEVKPLKTITFNLGSNKENTKENQKTFREHVVKMELERIKHGQQNATEAAAAEKIIKKKNREQLIMYHVCKEYDLIFYQEGPAEIDNTDQQD